MTVKDGGDKLFPIFAPSEELLNPLESRESLLSLKSFGSLWSLLSLESFESLLSPSLSL